MKSKNGKTAGIFALALVIFAGAGYFGLLPVLEKRQEERVYAFLQGLPGNVKADTVSAGFFDRRITITGLRGVTRYIDGSDLEFEIAELALDGLNLDAANGTGVADLAKRLTASGMRFASYGSMAGIEQPMRQEVDMAELELRDIRGDYGKLAEQLRAGVPGSGLLAAAASISLGSVSVKSYLNVVDSPLGSVQAVAGAFSIQDARLLGIGGGLWEGLRLSALGTDIFTLERLSIERAAIPDFYTPLLAAEQNGDERAVGQALFEAMGRSAIVFKGLEMRNLTFRQPMGEEALSARSISLDLDAGAQKVLLHKKVDGLVIPPSIYRAVGLQAAHFAEVYKNPLKLNGSLDVAVTQRDGKGELVLNRGSLEDPDLGSFSAEGVFLFEGEGEKALLDSDVELYLKQGKVRLEDKKFLDTHFEGEFNLMQSHVPGLVRSAAELRAQSVALLRREAAAADNPDYILLLEGFSRLMAAPGVLTISLKPEAPVQLDTPEDVKLNVTAEYVPAEP